MPLPFKTPVTLVAIVIAGVVLAFATEPVKPLALTTETELTVPVTVLDRVPPAKLSPVPTVTLEKPPDPFAYRMLEPVVAGAAPTLV